MDLRPDDRAERQAERYKRVLWDAAAGLCLLLAAAAFAVAVRCYIPYSFLGYMTADLRAAWFTALAPGAVASALALIAANAALKRLPRFPLISVCALMAAVAVSPLLLKIASWRNAVFVVNALIFFAVPFAVYAVLTSFLGKVRRRGALSAALLIFCAATLLLNSAAILYIFFRGRLLTASAAALTLPAVSLTGVVLGVGRMFSAVGKRRCDAAFFALLAVDCLSVCLMVAVEVFIPLIGAASLAVAVWTVCDLVLSIGKSKNAERNNEI